MLWRMKLGLKVLSGRVAGLRALLRRLGAFRHGRMDSADYATRVFRSHLGTASGRGLCVEIGPGEALLTALLARAAGFEKTLLVDSGAQLRGDLGPYRALASRLRAEGLHAPDIAANASLEAVLRACAAEYHTDGLRALERLPAASVDFSFSHAVLEHIPRGEVEDFLRALRRAAKPGSVSSHVIDLRDHLARGRNHLRFSAARWESPAIRDSGVYTNRLLYPEWLALFAAAGFEAEISEVVEFPAPVVPARLAPEFRHRDPADFRVASFKAVLRASNNDRERPRK